ncbi:abortive infection family protein [Micromonospora soli]|uniref:abortive infection family protein n=1 Tax=Micromonospora sp. NBRC 110009 TaxID=3061627 RepID=UPI002674034E|nr:abortive infection family protein [Micromonospora sp. NBRC 110009]WKU00879.1 abortive infection family protein [Micromonospora sp. NBRC 110009]
MTIRQLVPLPVRRHFRELAVDTSVLRLIGEMWQDQGFVPSGEPNDEVGERRTLWHEYEDNVDWTDPAHVARVLKVYETLLDGLNDGTIDATRKFLDRQGFDLDADCRIKPKPDSFAAVATRLPRSLKALRDPTVILDSFDRIDRALPADPAQAIGSAKELIEATAKTVLIELGVPFEDKTAKLPALIDLAQRALLLHPQTQVPGPDGSNAVKRILGGLISIATGLGELRNEGWGTGHAPAAPRVGLRPRHAHLAVGAAHTWCQLILDTLADPAAPWRKQATSGLPAGSTTT